MIPLIRIVRWAHELLAEVLLPGDSAVDLTAGNGVDTLFLSRQVGPTGQVLAFDIQRAALENTAALLAEAGVACCFEAAPGVSPSRPGVHLIHDSHDLLDAYCAAPVRAVIANLGYLPGGDPTLITRSDSTLEAIRQGLARLLPGGRLAVVVYVGHPGGLEESAHLSALVQALPPRYWHVLRLQVVNRVDAPYLLVVEKR